MLPRRWPHQRTGRESRFQPVVVHCPSLLLPCMPPRVACNTCDCLQTVYVFHPWQVPFLSACLLMLSKSCSMERDAGRASPCSFSLGRFIYLKYFSPPFFLKASFLFSEHCHTKTTGLLPWLAAGLMQSCG